MKVDLLRITIRSFGEHGMLDLIHEELKVLPLSLKRAVYTMQDAVSVYDNGLGDLLRAVYPR